MAIVNHQRCTGPSKLLEVLQDSAPKRRCDFQSLSVKTSTKHFFSLSSARLAPALSWKNLNRLNHHRGASELFRSIAI